MSQNMNLATFARKGLAFRNREFLTDVTVVCGAQPFRAHAYVLCSGSTYFEEVFTQVPFQSGRRIELRSVPAETFKIVLDYLYVARIPPEVENDAFQLTSVLRVARQLKIDELYKFCLQRLEDMLSPQYFHDLWSLSVEFAETLLMRRIIEYVASEFRQSSACVDFLKLGLQQLTQLLQHPKLDRSNADQIIKGILEWVKYNSATRRDHLHMLMSAFDINLLTTEYLKVLLNSEPLVRSNSALYDLVVIAASTRLLSARSTASQAAVMTGPNLLCFGKFHNGSAVTIFNRRTLTWSTTQILPFRLSEGTVIAAHNNSLYFVGGGETAAGATDTVLQYSHNEWILLSHSTLRTEVWKAGVGVFRDKMFVVGGTNRQSVVTNVVQCYDLGDHSCALVACTNSTYCVPMVVATTHSVFVVGTNFRTTVERFSPNTGQWTVVYPNRLPGISPRVATCMEKVYVISDVVDGKFRVFNPDENGWRDENFDGGPDEIRGMWSINSTDGQFNFLIVRDGRKALFSYVPDTHQWSLLANPVNHPWNWWQTVIMP